MPLPLGVEVELELELEPGIALEPLELGLAVDDDEVSVEVELEPDVDGTVLVDGDVLGDADGVVVPLGDRPLVRSVRDSLQAVSRPRLSATAKMAVSILFIAMPPPCGGVARPFRSGATAVPVWWLDRPWSSQYQCGVIRADAKEMRA